MSKYPSGERRPGALTKKHYMNNFKRIPFLLSTAAILMAATLCTARADVGSCPVTNADLAKVGAATKVVFVPSWNAPESTFREDNDPETLQIVVLSDKTDGPNQVSKDGQILFYQKNSSDAAVQKLLGRAFYIRFVLSNHLTSKCDGPWSR